MYYSGAIVEKTNVTGKNADTYNRWILEGYHYFSEVGPEAFSIKELSERAGLSRTSFHYYFDDKDDLFDQLIDHHMDEVRKFGEMATHSRPDVTEGIIHSMEVLKTGILFHVQLFTHRNIPKFNRAYLEGHEVNFRNGILDWFLGYFKLDMSPEEGQKAFLLFVDVLNSRFSNLLQTGKISSSFSTVFLEVIRDFQTMLSAYTGK